MKARKYLDARRILGIQPENTYRDVYAQFAMTTHDDLVSGGISPVEHLKAMIAATAKIGLLSDDLRKILECFIGEFVDNRFNAMDRMFYELCHDRYTELLRPLVDEPRAQNVSYKNVP